MKYLASHKVNKVKKKKVLHIILWPQFLVPSLQSKTIYCSPSGRKITKIPAQARAFAPNITVNLSNLCSDMGTHLHSLLRYRSAYYLVKVIERAAKATTQGSQWPPRTWNAPHQLWKRSFHSHLPEKLFTCKLFAAINVSFWFCFREGRHMDSS